jgi:hypothetical protein
LLAKIHFYGIQGTILNRSRFYLTDRKQKTEIKSSTAAQKFSQTGEKDNMHSCMGQNSGVFAFHNMVTDMHCEDAHYPPVVWPTLHYITKGPSPPCAHAPGIFEIHVSYSRKSQKSFI